MGPGLNRAIPVRATTTNHTKGLEMSDLTVPTTAEKEQPDASERLVGETAETQTIVESAKADSRKALITTVIAIALNPISLVAGYFINHYLQAPKLSIQYTIPIYTTAPRQLGAEGLKALADSPRMSASIRNTIAQRAPAGSPQSVCTLWLDGKDWNNECDENVTDALNGMQESADVDIAAIKRNIQIIDSWQPASPLVLEPVNTPDAEVMRLMQSIQGGQFDRKRALAQFRFYLLEYERNRTDLQHLKDAFDRMLTAPGAVTSEIAFKVGVLNSGDSDGVVFSTGKVSIGARTFNLNTDDYKVVKAHSFESVEFEMFYGEMDAEKRKISEIVQHQSTDMPYHIEVKSGDETLNADGVLPKDD